MHKRVIKLAAKDATAMNTSKNTGRTFQKLISCLRKKEECDASIFASSVHVDEERVEPESSFVVEIPIQVFLQQKTQESGGEL